MFEHTFVDWDKNLREVYCEAIKYKLNSFLIVQESGYPPNRRMI
jgi:hypothetical protein